MYNRPSVDVDPSRTASRGLLGALVLLLALTVPPAVQAQGGTGQGQRQDLMELREISRQLRKIQQKAMQDSALRAQKQQLNQMVLEAMRSMNDSTASRVDRLTTLQQELRAARKQQDTAGVRSAVKELRKLQQALGPVQKKVVRRPEIRKQMKAFREALRARMREINPKVDSLRSVADSLTRQLQGGMGGGGGSGGGR